MRTDDIPNTVCEEDEGCCGDSFGVAAHIARKAFGGRGRGRRRRNPPIGDVSEESLLKTMER